MILTRSVEREQVFAGKFLATITYAVVAIAIAGVRRDRRPASSPPASTRSPLSPGTVVSAPRGPLLVGASLLVYLLPILAIACIGLLFSAVFRNSGAAIVGTLMFSLLLQLLDIIPGLSGLHPVSAQHPVQRLAGPAQDPGGLGSDPSLGSGSARSTGSRP